MELGQKRAQTRRPSLQAQLPAASSSSSSLPLLLFVRRARSRRNRCNLQEATLRTIPRHAFKRRRHSTIRRRAIPLRTSIRSTLSTQVRLTNPQGMTTIFPLLRHTPSMKLSNNNHHLLMICDDVDRPAEFCVSPRCSKVDDPEIGKRGAYSTATLPVVDWLEGRSHSP